jgi:hypothetical protein
MLMDRLIFAVKANAEQAAQLRQASGPAQFEVLCRITLENEVSLAEVVQRFHSFESLR